MSNEKFVTPEYTAADALNDALLNAGVSHVFVNSGTDYPPIIESWAKADAQDRPKPEIIISPHEYAAMSAAQGFAQASGKPQAVFVHVDVGTQNMGGAVHNAFRCRTPAFILAGLSPYSMEGELPGGRDAYIQYIQNAEDQAGIVRGYTKHCSELKTGLNTQQMVYRALQIAKSEPAGPVYLTATREALEEPGRDVNANLAYWTPAAPAAMDDVSVAFLADALRQAEFPLIVTSYLGRDHAAVAELVKLCERLAIPVTEFNQSYLNFPGTNKLHLGNAPGQYIDKADLILVIDCDLPWIPPREKPAEGCRVIYMDIDPIKEDIPLWHIEAERFIQCNSGAALRQLNAYLDSTSGDDEARIEARRGKVLALRSELEATRKEREAQGEVLTPGFVAACVREIIDDDTLVLNEAISYHYIVDEHVTRSKPGTIYSSGGSSLGWFGGAAVGMKLACPDKDVVAIASDGTYIFSCPTAVYWMARRYNAPFLTVIFNNEGWMAPSNITKAQHPEGYAAQSNYYWTSFQPSADLEKIAEAAGGALAIRVTRPEELRTALREGMDAVHAGRCAVINVMLPPV